MFSRSLNLVNNQVKSKETVYHQFDIVRTPIPSCLSSFNLPRKCRSQTVRNETVWLAQTRIAYVGQTHDRRAFWVKVAKIRDRQASPLSPLIARSGHSTCPSPCAKLKETITATRQRWKQRFVEIPLCSAEPWRIRLLSIELSDPLCPALRGVTVWVALPRTSSFGGRFSHPLQMSTTVIPQLAGISREPQEQHPANTRKF